MARVINTNFIQFGPCKVVGIEIRTTPMTKEIKELWENYYSDGTYEKLLEIKNQLPFSMNSDCVGYMRDFNEKDNSFIYLVGMFMDKDSKIPKEFVSYDIPECKVAHSYIEGEENELYSKGSALTIEQIEKNGYKVDDKNFFCCEVYNEDRFGIPKQIGDEILILDYFVPYIEK